MPGKAPRKAPVEGGMDPKDVAAMDAEEYEDPGRDLMYTKPVDEGEGGRGARGDEENPVNAHYDEPYNASNPERPFGSDEVAKHAHGRKS